jgi:hypothetical protein
VYPKSSPSKHNTYCSFLEPIQQDPGKAAAGIQIADFLARVRSLFLQVWVSVGTVALIAYLLISLQYCTVETTGRVCERENYGSLYSTQYVTSRTRQDPKTSCNRTTRYSISVLYWYQYYVQRTSDGILLPNRYLEKDVTFNCNQYPSIT